jgi:hypothetical protein
LETPEDLGVGIEDHQRDVANILEVDLEEVENFKDVEITFPETKVKEPEIDVSLEEDQEDRDSKENLLGSS